MNKGGFDLSLKAIIVLLAFLALAVIIYFLFRNIDSLFASL